MKARTRSLADIRIVIGAVLTIIGLFLIICSAFLNARRDGEDRRRQCQPVVRPGPDVIAALMILWWTASPAGESGDENITGMPESEVEKGRQRDRREPVDGRSAR